MAEDSSASGSGTVQESQHALGRGKKKSDDLDSRQTPTPPTGADGKPLPAWKLREMAKSSHQASNRLVPPPARRQFGKPSNLDDPSLPPAFRAAFARQRKKEVDDFMSLDSVHSSKTALSNAVTQTPTSQDSDSLSDDSFDGHGSFASLGDDDDEDDEAYREGRNQLARQTIETARQSPSKMLRNKNFQKKGGLGGLGSHLDFIAE